MPERDGAAIDMKLEGGAEAQQRLGGIADGVRKVGESAKDVRGVLSAFGQLASVFGIVYAAIRTLGSGFEYIDSRMQAANRRALELDKSFGSLIGQLQSLGADGGKTGFPDLDKQLADLEKLREESNKLFRSGPFSQGERDEARNKELVEFQNKLAAEGEKIEATAAARRRARAEKEQQDRFDDAQRQIQAITREQLTEEERINDERERGIIEADALRRKAQDEFERQVADDLDAAVRARAEREMQLIRDRRAAEEQAATDAARERERREIEANRRIAEDMAEQMARALQDAYARGNAELLAGVNQVNSKLTVTANNILTVVRQLYANQPTGGR